ncbi:MAG: PIN domain-containing protein [Actinomycetota bacterium]|nr:PIN domain-containing protein [Actinomycetota bacterium]MDQ3350843.1 PIN domain-containing protein [Actinomycetota bacterium]
MERRSQRSARRPDGGGTVLTLLLLDTSVLIDAERSALDLDALIADDDEPAVAAITISELGVGVEIATGKRRQARRAFLDDIVDTLPVAGYDLEVARAHTKLLVAVRKAGRPRGAHDLIIAATALATGRAVVTSDQAGFADLGGVQVRRPT